MAHSNYISDPPEAWEDMVELMAISPPQEKPRHGPLAILGRLVFMSTVDRLNERIEGQLNRLGLTTTERPAERTRAASRVPEFVGPTVIEGERHGRTVEIRADPDRYRVKVGGPAVEFHVRSEDGRLLASERSPAALHEALAGLSPHERWEGAEAKGGPEGATVFHKISHAGWTSSGTSYLDDLWLAERLAEVAAAP